MGDSLEIRPFPTTEQTSTNTLQPVSTRVIRQNFPRQAPQRADAEAISQKRDHLQSVERDQRRILQEIKAWSSSKNRSFRL